MRTLTSFIPFLFLLSISFQSCQTDKKSPKDPIIGQDSLPDLKSRASTVKNLSTKQIFLKVPDEAFQIEGWDILSAKYRKELLSKGSLDGFTAKTNGNNITITEKFANEDDENERAAALNMVLFHHSEDDATIVFVSQVYTYEDNHKSDEIIDQRLWLFDGKSWMDISETMPALETKLFFDDNFDLSAAKKDFILLRPASINENTLSANLMYDAYAQFGLQPTKMITNETYAVNLIWNGQMFELQRKPSILN